MILAILETKPVSSATSNIVKVWIKTNNIDTAQTMALDKLDQEGIEVISIIELVQTDMSDYFPPCTSLDTFMLAEIEGIAILYS